MNNVAVNNDDGDDDRWRRFLIILLVIFIVVYIVLTFGWFYKEEEERKRIEEGDKKEKRLKEIEIRIKELEAKKKEIERTERNVIIGVRIVIGLIIVTVNCFFAFCWREKCTWSDVLNLNWSILMGYSFLAFITYGTIGNFISVLKKKLGKVLRRKHIDSLDELEMLIKERGELKQEIENLNKNISKG